MMGCEVAGRVGAAKAGSDGGAQTSEGSSGPAMLDPDTTSSSGAEITRDSDIGTSTDDAIDTDTTSSDNTHGSSDTGHDTGPPGETDTTDDAGTLGTCCEPAETPGCGDPALEACVCGADPYCCDTRWDGACVDIATFGACAGGCVSPDPRPPDECCAENDGGAGCLDPEVQSCVCLQDPYCCDYAWDGVCVDHVDMLGCGTCP